MNDVLFTALVPDPHIVPKVVRTLREKGWTVHYGSPGTISKEPIFVITFYRKVENEDEARKFRKDIEPDIRKAKYCHLCCLGIVEDVTVWPPEWIEKSKAVARRLRRELSHEPE